ncbi:MAG: DUF3857 domain-containing protein, partial [Bacteroidota bacterium]
MKNALFLLLLFSVSLSAQDHPEWSSLMIPPALLENANAVVRESTTLFEVKNERKGKLQVREIVTILNEESNQNMVRLYYDDQSKVKSISVKLYNALGQFVRKIDKDEIKDFSAVGSHTIYADNRVKSLEVAHSSYPFTLAIEYEQTLEGSFFFDYPEWHIQGYRTSIAKSKYLVRVPTGLQLHYKALNIDIEPETTDHSKYIQFTWSVSDLPALGSSIYGPPRYEVLPKLLISPDRFQFDDYSGSMADWNSFGDFIYRLFEGRDQLPPEMAAKVHELTDHLTDTPSKIEVLYSYLQENMRYVSVQLGIGGYQPFDADYVYNNKYGDCKALTNFMKGMLSEAGVESYPVLIQNGNIYYDVTEDFATNKFNHVILNVPSEDIWLECTSSAHPVNYIGRSNSDRNALMLTKEGGKLVRTPVYDASQNVESHQVTITLDEKGSASIKGKATETGAYHDRQRWLAFYDDATQKEKWFLKTIDCNSPKINMLEITASEALPSATVQYDLTVNRYATKAGKRLFVPLNQLNDIGYVPKEDNDRTLDIIRKTGYTVDDTIRIELPEGYQVESVPDKDLNIESSFGTYQLKIETQANQLVLHRKAVMPAFRVPASNYVDFRA